jgi:vanillate O-demethylase monooxygenase subunit
MRLNNCHPALRQCWHPVARSSEITDRLARVRLLGEPWVVYRSESGLAAFRDRCPHRLAPLSLGDLTDGVLRCAYHGWCFDPAGRCIEIPALGPGATLPPRAKLQAAAGVTERHGLVFLAPEAPLTPLPWIEEAESGDFETVELAPKEAPVGAGQSADNFLDFAHFPYVHQATIGTDESALLHPYGVERDGWTYRVVYEHPVANRVDPGVAAGLRPLIQQRRMTYSYTAPFALALRLEYLEAQMVHVIGFFIQPQSDDSCRLYMTIWANNLGGDPRRHEELAVFEEQVLDEDIALQETFEDLSLPLDLTAEVHTRADKTTVELRRVLHDLVTAAGNAGFTEQAVKGELIGATGPSTSGFFPDEVLAASAEVREQSIP